jgi:AraC family transcriptional activator of mtrCDE
MTTDHDALTTIAPMLRVRPELQDFCRFGGSWRSTHGQEQSGWAAFHIVTKGACSLERTGQQPLHLETGDVLLLPHGDGHVVYGGAAAAETREIRVSYRAHIRIKETTDTTDETELICGRLHLESASENLLLRTLPQVIVLKLGGRRRYADLIAMIREELETGGAGASAIASDLSSALFIMLLRHHLELSPPAAGVLALLGARETAKAAIAIIEDPGRHWSLDDLADLAAVSRATLVRAFKRLSGMAPLAFVSEVRLSIARHRLAHTGDPISHIAADVGYQSEAALSRAFHRRFGLRPGTVRTSSSVTTVPAR